MILLLFFQNSSFFLIFILFILIFLAGNLIYLMILIKKYNKNKKTIQQILNRLEENQKAKEQTEILGKEKSLFLTSLIHELKVPLSIVQSCLDIYTGIKGNEVDKSFNTLKEHIEKMNKNILNILDAEKIEYTGFLYDHNTILNITDAVKHEIEIFKSIARKKEINIVFTYEDSLYVKIDKHAFTRIMNNLLDNAMKYTPSRGEINVFLKADDLHIHLIIKDSGPGIPENRLQDIFKAYYKVERKYCNGFGIGLYIVKNIVDSAGGEIKIKSDIGKGTEIMIVFMKYKPINNDIINENIIEEPKKKRAIEISRETYDKEKYTLLIVDDDHSFLKFVQDILVEKYNIYFAGNGKEALNKLEYIPEPDIIISDIMMDIINGQEFYESVSKDDRYKAIPFIFISAKTDQDEKLKSLQKGVMDYLYKPLLIEEFLAKIQTILKNQEKTKEREIKRMEEKIAALIRTNGDEKFLIFEKNCKKHGLSPREKEIVKEMLCGQQIKEIAGKLFLSIHTVRNHIRKIYVKCGVQNRVELVNLFRE